VFVCVFSVFVCVQCVGVCVRSVSACSVCFRLTPKVR
jgi:hypothetical protein